MISKVHGSILHLHRLVREKEAAKWLTEATVTVSQALNSPVKQPPTATVTRRMAAAAASTSASTSAGAGVIVPEETASGAEEGTMSGTEREMIREVMKYHYVHLMEMDELIREKLFILQVNFKLTNKFMKFVRI